MDESEIWSVDRLAASNLLARLQLEATPDTLAQAERQLAEHRRTAMEWAAERAHASMVTALEDASQRYFPDRREDWCAGYRCAEQQAAAMTVPAMLRLTQGKAATKGQILRRLVRRARHD